MSILIELRPEIEAKLSAMAQQQEVPLSEYVRELLERHVLPVRSIEQELDPEKKAHAFREWVKSFPQHRTEPLPDAVLTREFYYERAE